jgi:predicted lipase
MRGFPAHKKTTRHPPLQRMYIFEFEIAGVVNFAQLFFASVALLANRISRSDMFLEGFAEYMSTIIPSYEK